jgi:hypothetical protein
MELSALLRTRKSVRAFLPQPVPKEVLAAVFADAQQAPSWCNIQPWRVYLTGGPVTAELVAAMTAAAAKSDLRPDVAWPPGYPEPYGTHRKECGKALYSAMGVAKDDAPGRAAAWMRNYQAFGAPHVAMVCLDRRWNEWAALDLGCWLQSLLLSLVDHGLAACAQAALGSCPQVVRPILGIPDEYKLFFGISLGYEDGAAPVNACRTSRAPIEHNVTFLGFGDGR